MSDDFKWFRSRVTGKTGKYPARFAERDSFEPIDSTEVDCEDCTHDPDVLEDEPDVQEPEVDTQELYTYGPFEDVETTDKDN